MEQYPIIPGTLCLQFSLSTIVYNKDTLRYNINVMYSRYSYRLRYVDLNYIFGKLLQKCVTLKL